MHTSQPVPSLRWHDLLNYFFFSSRRRHTRCLSDWSSDVCSSDLEGEPPSRLKHNCSGKHAGMLALCRAKGWRSEGYRLEGHHVQREILAVHAEAAEVPEDEIRTGMDGCGVLTFALPLERMAHAFARLSQLEGGRRIAAGMKAYPDLIRGPRAADTRLMKRLSDW